MTILFNDNPSGIPARQKVRPLQGFSDYVVNTLPQALKTGTLTELQHDLGNLLPGILSKTFNDVAILDLKMALNGCRYLAAKEGVGKEAFLSQPVHRQLINLIGRQPAMVTYEDIVLHNPPDDPRVFTTGRTALMEAQFYHGHRLIEDHLAEAITSLRAVLDDGDPADLERSHASLQAVLPVLSAFMTDLPKEQFNAFKPFFNSCPFTGEKGPSGAFSAKVPHVDALVYGGALPDYENRYLQANAPYFPGEDLALAMKAKTEGKNLLDLCKTGKMAGHERTCQAIANVLVAFRVIHLKTVKHQIGESVTGSAEGQGALRFLEQRVRDFTALRDRMAGCFAPKNTKPAPQRSPS